MTTHNHDQWEEFKTLITRVESEVSDRKTIAEITGSEGFDSLQNTMQAVLEDAHGIAD